ncbi:MAG: hypothetical protein V7L29_29660 [Nostoc sp.]|uniref:hypothetical protein n=1 Tax=Nostoc sp. TaxID=1180 RepID=UPI002FF9821B
MVGRGVPNIDLRAIVPSKFFNLTLRNSDRFHRHVAHHLSRSLGITLEISVTIFRHYAAIGINLQSSARY